MAPPVDLSLLKPGSRVKLRGAKYAPPPGTKPWPVGWKVVAETNANPSFSRVGTIFRVEGEQRWLPVSLIEEIVSDDPGRPVPKHGSGP